jgi:cobalamin biosynthesis protein CobD/CbiB
MSNYLPSRAQAMTVALQMMEEDAQAGRRRSGRPARAARRAVRREARRTPVVAADPRLSLLARTFHLAR